MVFYLVWVKWWSFGQDNNSWSHKNSTWPLQNFPELLCSKTKSWGDIQSCEWFLLMLQLSVYLWALGIFLSPVLSIYGYNLCILNCMFQKGTVIDSGGSQASFLMQAFTLTRRSFINMSRDFGYYWLRLVIYIVVTICIGTIYLNVGTGYNSILVLFLSSAPMC